MTTTLSPETIEQTIAFHGHWCPGLAIGIRVAEWALAEMGKADDEDIVAVAETDMCGVDAVQFLTGCTFGKGNLIHKDVGKNAFTFYRRKDGKAARLVMRPDGYGEERDRMGSLHAKMTGDGLTDEEHKEWDAIRARISKRVMDADLNELFEVKQPDGPAPQKARILSSMVCGNCGEAVMESRMRRFQGQDLCIPCFEIREKR
jgi:formylmethanofuran dehydrogenase subunit E